MGEEVFEVSPTSYNAQLTSPARGNPNLLEYSRLSQISLAIIAIYAAGFSALPQEECHKPVISYDSRDKNQGMIGRVTN